MSGPLPEISAEQRQTLDQVRENIRERERAKAALDVTLLSLSLFLAKRANTLCTLCVGVANDKAKINEVLTNITRADLFTGTNPVRRVFCSNYNNKFNK